MRLTIENVSQKIRDAFVFPKKEKDIDTTAGAQPEPQRKPEITLELATEAEEPKVNQQHVNALFLRMREKGVAAETVLKRYDLKDMHDMTIRQFKSAMNCLEKSAGVAKV